MTRTVLAGVGAADDGGGQPVGVGDGEGVGQALGGRGGRDPGGGLGGVPVEGPEGRGGGGGGAADGERVEVQPQLHKKTPPNNANLRKHDLSPVFLSSLPS